MALGFTLAPEPDRDGVLVTITGLVAADASVRVTRESPSGSTADVRGVAPGPVTGRPTMIVRDFEAPIGVPLAYVVRTYDTGGALRSTAGPTTVALDASAITNPWLVDLVRPLNSQQIAVEALRELRHEAPVGVHRVIGRRSPIVTSDLVWTWSGQLVFVTATLDERDRAIDALGTGVPVLLRTPPEQGVGNVFLSVLGFVEQRATRLALTPDRRFVVEVVQVDRPDPTLYSPVPPATYGGVKAAYATYAALLAARPTYDAVAYDYEAGGAPSEPWPPGDV